MRILLIHQAFAGPDEPGGTRHYEFARHCAAQGHEMTIVASQASYHTGRRVANHSGLITEQKIAGIKVLRTWAGPSVHRSFLCRLVSFFSFMVTSVLGTLRAGPADVIMGTSPPLFQAVSAWLVSAMRRLPFLLEVRDLWPEFAVDIGVLRNPVLIAMSRRLERFLYSHAAHVLVNSPAYRHHLLSKGVSDDKITLIANGVDPSHFHPDMTGQAFRTEWKLDNQFVVTYAGALGMANDVATVVRAASHLRDLPDLCFALVGDGRERSSLEALTQQAGLENVHFIGPRPKSQMAEVLAASNACVATLKDIPMFRTTYPNKVFDYMAAGRPVVLAIDGVIREVVKAAGAGLFVPPGDDLALANAVRRLYQNRDECREMGLAGRSYVVEHFNRNRQAQQFLSLIISTARSR
jgi:glycosyltransferase involved in cell wall biosynthesis